MIVWNKSFFELLIEYVTTGNLLCIQCFLVLFSSLVLFVLFSLSFFFNLWVGLYHCFIAGWIGMSVQRIGFGSCTANFAREHTTFIDYSGRYTNVTIHRSQNIWIFIARHVSFLNNHSHTRPRTFFRCHVEPIQIEYSIDIVIICLHNTSGNHSVSTTSSYNK